MAITKLNLQPITTESDYSNMTISQLTEQLNIERVRAKLLWGLITRLKTKLLSYNICHYINILIGKDTNFSRIKALYFRYIIKKIKKFIL